MALPLPVELELDRRSATAMANDIERAMSEASRNISRDFNRTMSGLGGGDMRRVGRDMGNNLRDGIRGSVDEAVRGVTGQFGAMGQAVDSTFSGMSTKAKVGAVGVAGIGLAAVGATKQLYDLGKQWDDVADGITARTGMVGSELTALTNTVKDLASTTALPIAAIGDIAGQVSQSLSLVGADAERMIQTLSQVQQLTGEGVNARGLGQAFRVFDIEDAGAQVAAVEDLLRMSQATGISVNELAAAMQNSGKATKEAGLGWAETAALLGAFEEAGVDLNRIMPTMSIALKNFAKDGRDPADALRETITEIERLGDSPAAIKLAQATFGRGYLDFLNAIKGTDVGQVLSGVDSELDKTSASLQEQIDATEDWTEEFQKLKNELSTGLAPIANTVFSSINQWLTGFKDDMQFLESVGGLFTSDAPPGMVVPDIPIGNLTADTPWGQNAALDEARRKAGMVPGPGGSTAPPSLAFGSALGQNPVLPQNPFWGYQAPDTSTGSTSTTMPVVPRGGDPMSLLQGFQPTSSLYGAAEGVLNAQHARAQAEADLNALRASNVATAEEVQTAENKILETDQGIIQAEMRLAEAKQSATEKYAKGLENATGQLSEIGASLDADFGISKGLAGIAENITKFIANLAFAPLLGELEAIKQANPSQGGYGLMGVMAAQGAFGPEFMGLNTEGGTSPTTGAAPAAFSPTGGSPNVNAMLQLAQWASGQTDYAPASDLVNGLADCSGSISDLYEVLTTGQTSPGREFTTTNFASPASAAKLGFRPGFMPGALNVGVNPYPGMSGHMAATLPNGVNFEGGGGTGGGAQYGGGAAGARDPQFEQQYYFPIPQPQGFDKGGIVGTAKPVNPWRNFERPDSSEIVGKESFQNPDGTWRYNPQGPQSGGGNFHFGPSTNSGGFGDFVTIWDILRARGYANGGIASSDTVPAMLTPGELVIPKDMAPGVAAMLGWPGFATGGGIDENGNPIAPGPAPGPTRIGGVDPVQSGSGGGGGVGITPGGSIDTAIGVAASGLDMIAPGAGQAAQTGIKLIGRAIQYGGEVAGIATQGIMDTFLPFGGSQLAQNSWLTRIVGGLAGAAPALPNMAGKSAAPAPPLQPVDPNTTVHGAGAGQPPGPVNITVHNDRATEDGTGRDVAYHLQEQRAPAGMP